MNYRYLDIENWNRKEHFHHFKNFEEPFFGVTVHIDVTYLYQHAKEKGYSFFICYLYAALKAANGIEAFKYRIKDENEILIYDVVNASPTINRPDGTFGFSYINFHEDFKLFYREAEAEIERIRNEVSLIPAKEGSNTIFFSALPWLKFTSLSHARKITKYDAIPRISFGKVFYEGDMLLMPTSIHVNHALMDGSHVGLFVEHFQENINSNLLQTQKSNEL